MPLGAEDREPLNITGDEPPASALTQKQVAGAQKATVNRTQLPSGGNPMQAEREALQSQGSKNGKGDPALKVEDKTPAEAGIAQGLNQMSATVQSEAEQALGYDPSHFNPAHPVDWLKAAAENPVEAYYIGRHIYKAYYGAFLDPGAIHESVHEIWNQDNAVGWLMRNASPFITQPVRNPDMLGGQKPLNQEEATAGAAGAVLPITGDPQNIAFGGMAGERGATMLTQLFGINIANDLFSDRHSPSDLAWATLPAVLLGGRLPPSVTAKLDTVAPGLTKVLTKLGAAKMAQDANKTGGQDRQKALQQVLEQGAMGEKKDVVARAWEAGMKPLSKEQEMALGRSLLERYGTLEREKLMPLMVRDGASAKQVQKVWTKLFRMPYDLLHVAPAELPLVNPTTYLHELSSAARDIVDEGHQWSEHMLNQTHLGPAGNDVNPEVSRFRSLHGLQQTNKLVAQEWETYLRKLAGPEADNPAEQALLLRSIESSGREAETAYHSLSPQMKVVRDSMRMVAAGVGMAAEDVGTIAGRAPNYWARTGLLVKEKGGFRAMRRGKQLLTREPNVHRALGVTQLDLLTETRMQVEQLYKTVEEANQAVGRQRTRIAQGILDGRPWNEIEQGLRQVDEGGQGVIPEVDRTMIEQIHALAASQPDVAKMEAEHYAQNLIPEFTTDPFEGIRRLSSQMRAITSRRAVDDLLNAVGKDGKAMAVARPTNDRAVEEMRKQGYRGINVPGFQHVMVNSEYGGLLEQAAEHSSKKLPAAARKLADIENAAISMIMYSPRIHGMNMSLRLGMSFAMHPFEVSRWFREGLIQKGGGTALPPMLPFVKGSDRVGHEEYRMVPWRYGLVPPNPQMGKYTGMWADSAMARLGELFGDTDVQRTPLVRDMANSSTAAKASSGAMQVLGQARDLLWGKQSELWSWVSDFGVMMWWIELAGRMRGGTFSEGAPFEEAARYATARANSWMGHVSPIDTNPNLHAALKTVMFAPNYWRTWGELLTGYYRNQGFGWSRETIKYVVENEVKTAMAAVLFQQLSANALNLAFSGHTIYQNDPGNWGKVEITQPWALEILNSVPGLGVKVDPKSGRDAKGAKLTWENPLARQVTDTEQLMGLLTSSPNWTPDTFRQGLSSFAAARTSPVMQALSALGNIDLYRSISADGARYVDPNHDSLGGNPLADLLTAAGDLTPFSNASQQIQQQIIQGNVENVQGPFGLPIPKAVLDAFSPGQLGQDAARTFLVGMTGVNPPFMRSSKTQGVSPTDDQYKTVHEIQTKYQQQMNALSTSTLSGQTPPYQWLAAYRQLSARHSAEMQAMFNHAPEYNNGPLGLTSSWEGLYDQATDRSGVLQPDKLRALQHQWRSSHSQADYAAVRSELRANDQKYPMLALYHKTLDAYDNWQADWCKANNVDVATLQSDLSGYATVYNDRNASRQWLATHPEISQFESAKKTEFESGQSHYGEAGLMYALFFNPTAADRYLTSSGETAQQVEQGVQQEQVPAAP